MITSLSFGLRRSVAINSINYMLKPGLAIKKIWKVLKPSGIFICVVNNHHCPQDETMTNYLLNILTEGLFIKYMTLKERFWSWWFNTSSVYYCAVYRKI